ncbi:hypothetical protein [Nonomuraea helvata]|uniref:GlsB/YeaQ/YmgE family stress response membrane protein n=1 Tax=Nonomuraea helvata TaxID=37484 RepID=A0ABV5RXC7_9ACTN
MAFIGVLLMIQGFGGLIAEHVFGQSFGLLHRWLDGTALTISSAVTGVAGLALTIYGVRKEES